MEGEALGGSALGGSDRFTPDVPDSGTPGPTAMTHMHVQDNAAQEAIGTFQKEWS